MIMPVKFHENPSSGEEGEVVLSKLLTDERRQMDGQKTMDIL